MAKEKHTREQSADTKNIIIDAALDIIIREGVNAATFRRLASVTGLSPGTMTYHFPSIKEILYAAFTKMALDISTEFAARLSEARDKQAAREAVVEIISGAILGKSDYMLFSFELYSFVSRNPEYRSIAEEWAIRSREALRIHFDADTARAVDALIEGFTIHNTLHKSRANRNVLMKAVTALTQ